MNQNKAKGALYEAKFRAEAMENGLHVFDPAGDYLPVDFILMNNAGRMFRVQVRGSAFSNRDGVRISLQCGNKKSAYLSSATYDILAGYCVNYDLWYLVPSSLCEGLSRLKFYPHVENSRGKWEKYRSAWDVFSI